MEQPTELELTDALNAARLAKGTLPLDLMIEAEKALKDLYDKKTTWYGKGENDLRVKIDVFLRGE